MSQKQNASGASATREASDMTLALEKTHIHTETYRRTQIYAKNTETHKNTQKHMPYCVTKAKRKWSLCGTQKYRELHALSEVKGKDFGRHTLYFIHTTSTPNIVKFVKDFLS